MNDMYQRMLERQVQLNPGTTKEDWATFDGLGLDLLVSKNIDFFQLYLDLGLLNPIEYKVYWVNHIVPHLTPEDLDRNRQCGATTNAIMEAIYQNYLGQDAVVFLKQNCLVELLRASKIYHKYVLQLEKIYGKPKGSSIFISGKGREFDNNLWQNKYLIYEME